MKYESLKRAVLVATLALAVYGCDGPGKGNQIPFSSVEPVEFSTESIDRVMDEESGMQSIDLLEGATAGGSALSGTIFIRELAFETLTAEFQTPGAGTADGSPFRLNGTNLDVDSDQFADALRTCDTSGDYPQSVDYQVTFIVDNGYKYPPGESHPTRLLNLTVNAINDPVTDVQAFDVSVAAGDSTPMLSATSPTYACNPDLTYVIDNTDVATIDAAGLVTGVSQGETTITVTSVEDPALFATATITVTPGFNLAITNQDFNELGAPLGTKSVPECWHIGISVDPSIVADDLEGAYTYDWSAVNAATPFVAEESDGAFGATGRFANSLAVGEMSDITVGYGSGYSGATAGDDVVDQTVTVTAEANWACNPGLSSDGGTYASDLGLDGTSGPGRGPSASFVNPGLDGTALLITSPGGDIQNVVQQLWNNFRNFHSNKMGLGEASIGLTYKFSVWAKLGQLPSGGEVILEHTLLPWNCEGCAGLPDFPARRPFAGTVTTTLKPTTDWQLVEFINPLTGTNEWSVPAHWNVGTQVFQFWDVYGLAIGETIQLDNYGIVEVTP